MSIYVTILVQVVKGTLSRRQWSETGLQYEATSFSDESVTAGSPVHSK